MRSMARYSASPCAPPKPPVRVGTGTGAGAAVRPANDKVTAMPARPASRSLSCRASNVPPRMRIRMPLADPLARENAAPCRWLSIVGVGEDGIDGLAPVARDLIAGAEFVFGGKRHLGLVGPLVRGIARPW